MVIDESILQELKKSAGEQINKKAQEYVEQRKVKLDKVTYEGKANFQIHAKVRQKNNNYSTYLNVQNGEVENLTCTCLEYKKSYGMCEHILASAIEFDRNPEYISIFTGEEKSNIKVSKRKQEKYRIFRQMVQSFYLEDTQQNNPKGKINTLEDKIHLVPKIIYSTFQKNLKLELKIGNKQLYKLKNLVEFYDHMQEKTNFSYGTKLTFVHEKDNFALEDQELLNFTLKYAEIIKYANFSMNHFDSFTSQLNSSYITLSNTALDDLFNTLKNRKVEIQNEYKTCQVQLIDNEPEIPFFLEETGESEYALKTDIDVYSYTIWEGKQYIYFYYEDKVYKCSKDFKNTILQVLEIFRKNFTNEIIFSKNEATEFFSLVMPRLKKKVNLDKINYSELEKYIPKELKVKLFLDYDVSHNITADIEFCYGDKSLNPFIEDKSNFARDVIGESKVLDMFKMSGFMFDGHKNHLVLVREDDIYEFLKNGLDEYIKRFEVLATDRFKQRQIKEPKMSSVGVRVENNLLYIDLSNLDFDPSEIEEILQKYQLKKKYHRLKDGSFLDLSENETMDFLDSLKTGANVSYKDLEKQQLKLPAYRSLYLERLLKQTNHIAVKQDGDYTKLVDNVDKKKLPENMELPEGLNATLRNYQQLGYHWLKVLDSYGLGGILADDMGLGKTIQLLAVILDYVEKQRKDKKQIKPTMVICPSSLTLNWKSEAAKFTPTLKVLDISGNLEERKRKILSISNYDLIITSYDLLKRDIEEYEEKNYEFQYIIADEAQYIKNNNTKNAKAIKRIHAKTCYALTGTPIENSLSELWSIFDFIMPGYLFSYTKFKNYYEIPITKDQDEISMKKLRMMIEPFVLRRVKENVLTELPDKTITVLNNEMEEEQQKIYLAYMKDAKKEATEEIKANGIANSQIKILALLTRLRQICCHPALFIDKYEGQSSKLNQCIEIMQDAIRGGHKILLFSGYASMFPFIEQELNKQNIKYFKLTGQTKVEDRMDLVNAFNNKDDVKVFLISLKAGGTGLNLIGADVVIHYDPWWNLSAENQATDRTYRIGQKKNVQVYKLITKNSIEEKIYDMQKRKAKLMDDMLSTKETFISKLSKEEIMELFS